jgi:serine/threonine protein phosphatase PrpC
MVIRKSSEQKGGRWIRSVKVSETGLVRGENQDSVLVGSISGLYCVADGMGGGAEGARASAMVCEEVYRAVSRSRGDFASQMEFVEFGLQEANAKIYNYAKLHDYRQMGSTAAILIFDKPESGRAAICHVGDTRVYRIRDGLATLLTRDHTVGMELGALLSPKHADDMKERSHPLAHVLTRAVGTDRRANPEWRKIDVAKGDRFLICSDGVHDVLSDTLIGFLAGYGPLEDVKSRLDSTIVENGAPDNYSFILLSVGEDE